MDICKKHRAIGKKGIQSKRRTKKALKKHGATQLISENIEICKKLSENRKEPTQPYRVINEAKTHSEGRFLILNS